MPRRKLFFLFFFKIFFSSIFFSHNRFRLFFLDAEKNFFFFLRLSLQFFFPPHWTGSASSSLMPKRKLQLQIFFEMNLSGDCPRKVSVIKKGPCGKSVRNFGGSAKSKIELTNIKPRWCSKSDCYILPFFGRVKETSAKNFHLKVDGRSYYDEDEEEGEEVDSEGERAAQREMEGFCFCILYCDFQVFFFFWIFFFLSDFFFPQ